MIRSIMQLASFLLALAIVALGQASAPADIILEQYEFNGQTGMETSVASSLVTSGLTGMAFSESSVLTPSTGMNSINSSGWNLAGASYSFGFNVNTGQMVTVDQLTLTSRSSATGPGTLYVMASADGGPATVVGTIVQPPTNVNSGYNDEMLALKPVSALHSLIFTIVAANQTAAGNGTTTGTIGSTGTFRVGDYNPTGGTAAPFTISGIIAPVGSTTVPEPTSIALISVGLLGIGLATRARRSQSCEG